MPKGPRAGCTIFNVNVPWGWLTKKFRHILFFTLPKVPCMLQKFNPIIIIMLALYAAKSSMTSEYKQGLLSFDANFSSFLLAESPPRDLQKKYLPTKLIIFCSLMKPHFPPSCYHSCVKMADCFRDRVIKQLLNSVKRASSICLECLSPLICSPVTYSNLLCT